NHLSEALPSSPAGGVLNCQEMSPGEFRPNFSSISPKLIPFVSLLPREYTVNVTGALPRTRVSEGAGREGFGDGCGEALAPEDSVGGGGLTGATGAGGASGTGSLVSEGAGSSVTASGGTAGGVSTTGGGAAGRGETDPAVSGPDFLTRDTRR